MPVIDFKQPAVGVQRDSGWLLPAGGDFGWRPLVNIFRRASSAARPWSASSCNQDLLSPPSYRRREPRSAWDHLCVCRLEKPCGVDGNAGKATATETVEHLTTADPELPTDLLKTRADNSSPWQPAPAHQNAGATITTPCFKQCPRNNHPPDAAASSAGEAAGRAPTTPTLKTHSGRRVHQDELSADNQHPVHAGRWKASAERCTASYLWCAVFKPPTSSAAHEKTSQPLTSTGPNRLDRPARRW